MLAQLALVSLLLAPVPTAEAAVGPTVAVLYFDYGGETAGMGVLKKGLAQMLISDLSEVSGIRLVERTRLEAILAEQDLARKKTIDAKTAARLGKLLGAHFLVLGSYFDLMGTLRVDARMVHVQTGRVVKSVGAEGKDADFIAIEAKVGDALSEAIDAELRSPAIAPTAPPPRKPKERARKRPKKLTRATAVRYSAALDLADKGNKVEARKTMKDVVDTAPDFQLAAADLLVMMQ